MKKSLLSAAACLLALAAQAQLKMSVMGDSYSTFDGVIPEGYEPWYFTSTDGNDVNSPDQLWWSILSEANALELDKVDAWSGSTVSYSGYRGEDYKERSFNTRVARLGSPDVIFIFGGTNDDWAKSPLGDYKYSGWEEKDMYAYRPAFAKLLSSLQEQYPDALLINICNSDLRKDIVDSMAEICSHYGVHNVRLSLIDKQRNHPSQSGMRQIAHQVWKSAAPVLYDHLRSSKK